MKKAITLSAATLALLVAGASGASVKAEPWSSTGTIGFTANTKTPPAITNPEVPGGTGPRCILGELAIDYVSDLAFGKHEISAKSETYFADADTTNFNRTPVGDFVEMHDLRGLGSGDKKGTQLNVTQSKQFNNDSAELKGATLSFSAGTAANAGGGAYTPTAEAGFILKPGTAQKVMSTDGTVGQFLTSYGKAADYKGNTAGGPISLSVPSGSALAGDFSTTLVWDLVTAP
ncbi:WxL domain-containing protein [Lactococcus lactis]|uniref:WxL domain-containing protein n=1 Tax=Lactococcus lactis TaxID=1358 RepID=UPI00288C83AC|nr:WxL domain-containing protein [Lactococcus lactis]MDT2888135.1 WxL domain-containing protein [Lactococcus lactis]MDT2930938.1 WxL domain-containing protein [Lactococcus lactis]